MTERNMTTQQGDHGMVVDKVSDLARNKTEQSYQVRDSAVVKNEQGGQIPITGQATADAYAAIVTPPGISGVATIRLSGPEADVVADRIFRFVAGSARFARVADMPGYTAAFGSLIAPDSGRKIDQCVLLNYRAPHSYTGENTVELSVHGGAEVSRQALAACFSAGARPAEPGEFTRNAFLNGKLDLAQAEAVMDLIKAETSRTADAALRQLEGGLSTMIRRILDELYAYMAELEMAIEYPEHEDSVIDTDRLRKGLAEAEGLLRELAAGSKQGRVLRQGLQVVLTGLPNVGKSSLLNELSGADRSIVTNIPGTTRDTIELDVDIDGIPVHLTDTAGLRHSDDPVEQIGVERAHRAMSNADLLIWMVAPPRGSREEESFVDYGFWLDRLPADKPLLLVSNKDDLPDYAAFRHQLEEELFPRMDLTEDQLEAWKAVHGDEPFAPIYISAQSGNGVAELTRHIVELYEHWGNPSSQQVLITSERHRHAIHEALVILAQVNNDIDFLPFDILAQSLIAVAEQLALIVGDRVADAVIDEVFSRFCVGK